ncbi:unnamed protein product, partial [Nesidiocoris tenuis]
MRRPKLFDADCETSTKSTAHDATVSRVYRFSPIQTIFQIAKEIISTKLQQAVMAEWLRRLTRNQIPSGS